MPTDELIRAIEQTDPENLQDILDAVIRRCRELNPGWDFFYFARDPRHQPTDLEAKILQFAMEMGGECSGG